MFSQELENLIQATLEDGKLEPYEKEALVKRAEAEGVDLTELEIYINSILQKRQRELEKEKKAAYAKAEKKKKEEFGRVCPNCGKQVPSMTLKCECGYEFSTQKKVSSIKVFSDKLEKVKEHDKKIQIISTFPVPNTKEDIIEFLALSISEVKKKVVFLRTKIGGALLAIVLALITFGGCYAIGEWQSKHRLELMEHDTEMRMSIPDYDDDPDWLKDMKAERLAREKQDAFESANDYKEYWTIGGLVGAGIILFFVGLGSVVGDNPEVELRKAWRAKYEQVLMKGRSLRGDAEFTRQLDYFEEQFNR